MVVIGMVVGFGELCGIRISYDRLSRRIGLLERRADRLEGKPIDELATVYHDNVKGIYWTREPFAEIENQPRFGSSEWATNPRPRQNGCMASYISLAVVSIVGLSAVIVLLGLGYNRKRNTTKENT